ncbi:MAG TPA: hypothetical protein VGM27_33840 [Acidobacteriaceae bacterium]
MEQRRRWTQTVRVWWSGERAEDTPACLLLEEQPGRKRPSIHQLYKAAAAFVVAALVLGPRAHGQFGIDTAAILAALHQMQSLMQNYIAAPLKTINQAQQSIAKYEQEVMYPMQAIQQARSSVTQFENHFKQLSRIYRLNVSSATLPQSQALESVLLSRNPSNLPNVTTQFQNVYGLVMTQGAASPDMRNMTDTTDAQAQDAMKRAIQIDALADTELAEADKMGQQISVAAPGSAPILEAEADAWVVRANAYTQAALAELMRTRAVEIANQSKVKKIGTSQNSVTNSFVNSSLSR